MIFAPAVLDQVYVGVKKKFAGWKAGLLRGALRDGARNYARGGVGCTGLVHKLLMKKVQKLLGGRITMAVAGSAPLSEAIQIFCQTCFNCPVRQGYGLTETCAASCVAVAYVDPAIASRTASA